MNGLVLVSRAADFAAQRHAGIRRKGRAKEPYINHLAEVAALLADATEGADAPLIAAGWLHDTVEDTPTSREESVVDEHILHMRKLLKTSLEDLDLSVRAYNCLKAAKINTLAELVRYDTHELLKFRNFGKKSLVEIEELLQEKNLTFGMDLAKYKLEED